MLEQTVEVAAGDVVSVVLASPMGNQVKGIINVAYEPKALVEGNNAYELAAGDTAGESFVFTATKDCAVKIAVTEINAYDDMSGEWGALNPNKAGRFIGLTVNGVNNFMLEQTVEVAAGDVVSVVLASPMGNQVKGIINVAYAHTYDDNCDADCNACGEERTAPHTYDDNCDDQCNVCEEFRWDAPHNLTTYVEAEIPENCQEQGHPAYWICEDCGNYYRSKEDTSNALNPAWMYYTGDHVRPEDAAACATVPCKLCGEDSYGDELCVRPEGASECVDSICENCHGVISGYGHSYGYDEEGNSLIPLCQSGICINCNEKLDYIYKHNGSVSCIDSECEFGCGQVIPASSAHVMYDENWSLVAIDPCVGGTCENCYNEIPGNHNYVDGVCSVCGETDPNYKPEVAVIETYGKGLNVKDEIAVNYYFKVGEFTQADFINDTTKGGLLIWTTEEVAAAGEDMSFAYDAEHVQAALSASGKSYWLARSHRISAKDMDKTFFARAYIVFNNEYIYGEVIEFSPKMWAQEVLNKEASTEKGKIFATALMQYGAAFQELKGATSLMTDDMTNLVEVAYNAELESKAVNTGVQGDMQQGFKLYGKGLNTAGALGYNIYYTLYSDAALENAVSYRLAYWTESEYAENTDVASADYVEMNADKYGYYLGVIPNIAPKDLDVVYYACAYAVDAEGNVVATSKMITFNAFGYAVAQIAQGGVKETFGKALIMYQHTANAYLG